MSQSFVSLHYHLIFSTKNRVPTLTADLQPRLQQYIGGILRNEGCTLVAAGGMPDHIHLLISLGKQISVADALREIKSRSSSWIHGTFPSRRGFEWQVGYGAFAVSYSDLDRVREYLKKQAEHHRTMTFQEEFLEFLKRHHIEYDERYLWD